jgi:hypothetical protein
MRRVIAERTNKCPSCGDMIIPGDEIVMEDDQWVHEDCNDPYRDPLRREEDE